MGPTPMKPVEKSERRVNWVLISVMVVAYSLMSLLIGVEFEAEVAIPYSLFCLFSGYFSGEVDKGPRSQLVGCRLGHNFHEDTLWGLSRVE